MGSTVQDRAHLKLLNGGYQPPGLVADTFRLPVLRVPVGPGEWVLALLMDQPEPSAQLPTRDLLRRLKSSYSDHGGYPGPAGRRCVVIRARPNALDPGMGPAVLHHSGAETVLYCRADQITPQAAETLAALAARSAEVLGPSATKDNCNISVSRLRHRDLSVDLHPAVMTVRGRQVTAHVCSRLITHELAVAIGILCTAYARHVSSWPPAPRLRWAAEPSSPEWEERDAAGRA